MKKIGFVLLGLGFLAGAYVATSEIDRVEWATFVPCAGAMFVGLVLVRAAGRGDADDLEAHGRGVDTLDGALERLIAKLETINAELSAMDVYDVHGRLDRDLMEDLDTFVEARESMIPLFGLQTYAEVMSAFANGERNINRAWSASADGYVDEVAASLGRSESRMREAKAGLAEARETAGSKAATA